MKSYNLVVVFNQAGDRLLLCKRKKEPYLGLSNFVGGKIEPGEDSLSAAYRELWEETGITKADIRLTHLMDLNYYVTECLLEVYVGRLNKELTVFGDENELYWSDLDHNFFDTGAYAGYGNMGHILLEIQGAKEWIPW